MHKLLMSLAATAAFLPCAAFAQEPTDAQKAEEKCVYTALTADQREQVLTALYGEEAEAAAAQAAAQPVVSAAVDGCARQYSWGSGSRSAAEQYTVALIGYEGVAGSVPKELAAKLDTLMGSFPLAYAETFSQEGHSSVTDEEAWEKDAYARLEAAGIAEGDRNAAIIYLAALADVYAAGTPWLKILEGTER